MPHRSRPPRTIHGKASGSCREEPGIVIVVTRNGEVIPVATLDRCDYRVLKDNGDWLRVRQRGKEGWLEKTDALLPDEAVKVFSRQLAKNPRDAFALKSRAAAYIEKKEFDRAIADSDAAIKLGPADSQAFDLRGRAYIGDTNDDGGTLHLDSSGPRVSPNVASDRGTRLDRAIEDFSEAIRIEGMWATMDPRSPSNADTFDDRGMAFLVKGDFDQAIADFTEAIRLETTDSYAFCMRGNTYLFKNDFDRAMADFNEAIRLDPRNAYAFDSRGAAFHAKSDLDRAIADYSEAIRLDPKAASFLRNRGVAYAHQNDYDRAITDLSEAIRIDPKYGAGFGKRGAVYLLKEEYDRAIADFTEAIRLKPGNAVNFRSRGDAHFNKKELDKAILDYTEAIRLNPKDAAAYRDRGHTRLNQEQLEQAMADLSEAIRLDPKDAVAFNHRAMAHRLNDDLDRALADVNEAIRLDPREAAGFRIRGSLELAMRDYDRAIADLTEGIRLDPTSAAAFCFRGLSHGAKLDVDRATADFTEAIRLDPKLADAYRYRAVAYLFKADFPRAREDYAESMRLGSDTTLSVRIRVDSKKDFWGEFADALVSLLTPYGDDAAAKARRKQSADPTDVIPTPERWDRVKVDGTVITRDEMYASAFQQLSHPGSIDLPEEERADVRGKIIAENWQDMIDCQLVLANLEATYGKKRPQYVSHLETVAAAEFEKYIKRVKANLEKHGYFSAIKDPDLRKYFSIQGTTYEAYRRHFERNFMMTDYLRAQIWPVVQAKVKGRQIAAYYQQHGDEFTAPDSLVWQDVFIDTSKFPDAAKARQVADKVQARAARGDAFLDLVKAFDQGDSSYRQGEGAGQHPGEIAPAELEPVLFKLKAGEVGPVIAVPTGFHVVKVVKRVYAGVQPLDDELKEQIRKDLATEVAEREKRRIIQALRRKATIEIERATDAPTKTTTPAAKAAGAE